MGGDQALAKALRAEQVWENEDGTISWREGAADTVKGERKTITIEASKKLNAKQHQALDAAMDAMGWKTVSAALKSGGKKMRMLAGEALPTAVKETLDDASQVVNAWKL